MGGKLDERNAEPLAGQLSEQCARRSFGNSYQYGKEDIYTFYLGIVKTDYDR
jgi:hypothetical protein